MTAKFWAYAMATGAAAYMVLMLWQGVRFFTSGGLVTAGLGLAVMVLPLIGLWLVWREIQFASQVQALAQHLGEQGELPPELPRTASGRVQPEAAAVEFADAMAALAESPRAARAWFRLSWAYEAGRDRTRARAAMRYAVALSRGVADDAPPAKLLPPN